jgi:hypothetical protein
MTPMRRDLLLTGLLELQDAPVDVCNFFHGERWVASASSPQGVPQPSTSVPRLSNARQHPRRVRHSRRAGRAKRVRCRAQRRRAKPPCW